MKSMQLKSNVGKDGILRLQVPINMPEQEIEIVLVIQPVHKQTENQYHTIERGWPDNFFKDIVGAWSGDLVRPSQGNFETREEL
ncbi:MAG: hypothetical protein GY749_45685 [Desulfobacteraceae bacterium]|nr:hypothetical protein [Desulfobacteraceae bacterium]MCP4346815.1 hypothetical protein [Desulfobacterales bacterium]